MAATAPHHSDALDAQLVLRAQDGDRAAFTELFRRHAHPAWRLALAVGGSAELAAPAVAKGYTLALVRLHRRTTTLATPFRHLVTRASAETAASASRQDDSPVDPAPNDLAEAFLSLPERWRAALWLTAVEGGTPAQVAPIVGLSEEGTASLVDRARAGLKTRHARSTPLGAYFLRDNDTIKSDLRAIVVPMPLALESAAVQEWEAWQRTLTRDKRHGLGAVIPLRPGVERAVSAAAVAVFAAGIAAAVNLGAREATHAPNVALPITRNDSAHSMTYTPAAFVSAPSASLGRSAATGRSVHGSASARSSSAPAVSTPTTVANAATAGANAGSGNDGSQDQSPPADTQGSSTPNASAGTDVAGTPVAVTVGTDGAGVTVGDTTIGDSSSSAPTSGVTVTADPGGGLAPISVTIPLP